MEKICFNEYSTSFRQGKGTKKRPLPVSCGKCTKNRERSRFLKQYVVLRLKFCLLYTVCTGETPRREKEICGGCPEGERQQENCCVYGREVIGIGNLAKFQKVSARQPQYGERQQTEIYGGKLPPPIQTGKQITQITGSYQEKKQYHAVQILRGKPEREETAGRQNDGRICQSAHQERVTLDCRRYVFVVNFLHNITSLSVLSELPLLHIIIAQIEAGAQKYFMPPHCPHAFLRCFKNKTPCSDCMDTQPEQG